MAKRFFQVVYSSSIPNTATYGRVYFLDVLDEVVYGGDIRPCNYFYTRKSTNYGSSTRWIYATPDGTNLTPRFQIGYYSSPSWDGQNGQRVIGVDDNSPILSYIGSTNELSVTTINGKYRFNDAITNLLNFTYNYSINSDTNASFPISFNCNGVDYIGISFKYTSWGTSPTPSSVIMYRADDTYESYTLQQFSSTFRNQTVDFGVTPQDVPVMFVDWFSSQSSVIYPYSYTVKSFTGDTVLASIAESPSMVRAQLTVVGNQKTLRLTGANGRDYTLSWLTYNPEGKQFIGLSNTPESNRVILPSDTSIEVSWEGDLVLYESYGTYRPPATTFDINLYQNSAEVNRVDKGQFLVGVGTLSGALREECSMLTPSIVYQSENVPTFNYVYIPIFNRYYFVTSLSSVSKNVWRMELNCDVLMTYKEQIFLLQGVIGRQEVDFNPLLVDNELPTQNNPIIEVIDIPSDAFDTQTSDAGHNYVITVIGV